MQSFINQNTYPSPSTSFPIARRQGDDGVDEFLALDKFGRFHAVAKDLVEKVGQHRLAEGGHIRALGDSLHEGVTHLLVLDIGG